MKKNVKKIMLLMPENISGGAERVLTSLANEFSNKGIKTYLMTFDSDSDFYPVSSQVNMLRLNTGTAKMTKFQKYIRLPIIEIKRFKRMKMLFNKIKPDVVISFMFMTNIIGCMVCKQLNIPIILSERNDPLKYPKWKRMIMKHFYSKSDGFVCQSEIIKKMSEKDYGLKNIVVIDNPLSENQFASTVEVIKEKTIISVGRLIPQKNHELLIRSFSNLPETFNEYKLCIFGTGELKAQLSDLIKSLKMEKRIFLMGVEKNAIINHRNAELFVLPSDFEGYPNVLVEAMANGIASVSTDFPSGSARSIINNYENGVLVPVADEIALTNAIIEILSNDKLRKKIETNCREIISQTHISVISQRWIDYANSVMKN